MLNSPDTNPDVTPTPIHGASGWWASVGSLIGLIVDVLPILGPVVPDSWKPYVPVVGAVCGLVLHRFFRDSYTPVK